jgi:quaternary ammonium compound-resistance protein SugE
MSTAGAWATLFVAGVLDVLWAVTLKLAEGHTRIGWTCLSLILLAAFVFLLGQSLRVLPVGTAYAVWTGIGAVGTVLVGAFVFGERMDVQRFAYIALIVVGIAGLHSHSA